MQSNRTKVLIVDDSALIREMISDLLSQHGDIQVLGTAGSGTEAIRMARALRPDVITLDVMMPGMDGLETLDAILSEQLIPAIMVSAATQLGGQITIEALERGALDYIAKPEGLKEAESTLKSELVRKVRSAVDTDFQRVLAKRKERAQRRKERQIQFQKTSKVVPPAAEKPRDVPALWLSEHCIALGISTGGPPALASLFETLSPDLPPIVVVQHMPANFTSAFAKRLDSLSRVSVKEAESGDILKPGCAYVAPGGRHLAIRRHGANGGKLRVFDGDPVSGHRPSVDVMMNSAAEVFGSRALGVVMTGMGRDGSDGCGAIRAAGGYVLGQDEQSSDLYGMNKVAYLEGNVDRQFCLEEAAAVIEAQVSRLFEPATVKN